MKCAGNKQKKLFISFHVYLRFFVIPKSDQNKEYPYGFKFNKNSHSVEIYTNDVSYFTLWRNLFSMKLVQTTFHEEYEVRKMIGKGSFAKVII